VKDFFFHLKLQRQEAQRFWHPLYPERITLILHHWNTKFFSLHGTQIALCKAFAGPQSSRFALYFFSSAKTLPPAEGNDYCPLPQDLWRLDIFSPPPIPTVTDITMLGTGDTPGDHLGAWNISLISSN
jgi:hypothetical protein